MKRILLFIWISLFAFLSGAQATLFTFSGTDEGGIGSATMDISISGNTLTVTLNNTSPIYLDPDNTTSIDNAPGITGFGFDLYEPLPGLSSWQLTAYTSDLSDSVTTIGSPDNGVTGSGADGIIDTTDDEWSLNTTIAGVTLDFLPTTDQENIDGALFNPSADGSSELPGGNNDVFYTTAILTMIFDEVPSVDITSLFVRMQNVGENGEGSLKLYPPPGGPGDPIPEPATMLLLGSGLIGIAVSGKKRFKKTNK